MPADDLPDVCRSGDTRAALEALRDVLAERLEIAPAYATAPIASRLKEVLLALDARADPQVSTIDELLRRRQARRAVNAATNTTTTQEVEG